jgi:hypothetical protein
MCIKRGRRKKTGKKREKRKRKEKQEKKRQKSPLKLYGSKFTDAFCARGS